MVRRRTIALGVFLPLAVCLLATGIASGANGPDTWNTSPTAGNWSVAANWASGSTNKPPISGDSLVFGASSITTLTDDLTAGISLAGITFNSGDPAYTIGGNSITLTGNITNNGTALEAINDALSLSATSRDNTTVGAGNITLGGAISGGGGLSVSGGATLTLSVSNSYSGGTTIDNGATLTITNANGLGNLSTDTAAINGGGTLDINIGGTVNNTFSGSGTINLQGSSQTFLAASLSGFIGTFNVLTNGGGKASITASGDSPSSPQLIVVGSSSSSTATLYTNQTLSANVTIDLWGAGNSKNFGTLRLDSATVNGSVVLESNNVTLGGANGSVGVINGVISDGGNGFGVGMASASTKTIELSGANTYSSSAVQSSASGTLELGNQLGVTRLPLLLAG